MDHTTLKQILVGFFSLYLVILGFLYVFGPASPISERGLGTAQGPEIVDMFLPTPAVEEVSNNFSPKIVVDTVVPAPVVNEDSYSFKNTLLAYEALSQLEVLPEKGFKPEDNKKKPYENLKNEDGYCDRRRAYFVLYPEELFEEMTFLSDNNPDTLVRKKMLSKIGVDAMPHIGSHIAKDDKTLYEIDPSITNFYSRYVLFNSKQLGRQFSCLSQISNHVPGKIVMGRKFAMTEAAIAYAKRYESRPQCFTFEKFIPKTHLLYDKEDCENFFKALNSPEYQAAKKNQKVIYLKKAGEGVHMGAGVDPVDEAQEADLRAMYDNGKKCGKINDVFLIQKYIPNPLLINGRKFDFRSYVMIASVNPLIAYYHDGTLRVSLMQYDPNSTDKKTVLTNIALNKEIYEEARDGNGFQGMSEDELKTAQQWTFARFEQYLLDSGVVKDRSWFDTYLRPQFKKAMIHLLRFGIVSTVPSSSVYSIFGLDFMLDEDFNLWFIEANSAPGMDGFSEPVENHVLKMLKDEVEIAMGLLRSRMKRVVKFVNELIDNGSIRQAEDGTVSIRSLEMNKMIFEKITQNYFEEEFLPSPGNGFSKIIDGNYPGAGKYLGFLSEECL